MHCIVVRRCHFWQFVPECVCNSDIIKILFDVIFYESIVLCSTDHTDFNNVFFFRQLVYQSKSKETTKTEAPCHSRCGTIMNPPYTKTTMTELRPTVCRSAPARVSSKKKFIIYERDIKQHTINQSAKIRISEKNNKEVKIWPLRPHSVGPVIRWLIFLIYDLGKSFPIQYYYCLPASCLSTFSLRVK